MITVISLSTFPDNTKKPVKSDNRVFFYSPDRVDINFSSQKNLQKLKIDSLSKLKMDVSYAVLVGTFKDFRKARKVYAKEAIKDFEAAKAASGMKITNIPVTSKLGMKIMYFMIRGFFTKKTPEEKALLKLAKLDKLQNKYFKRS